MRVNDKWAVGPCLMRCPPPRFCMWENGPEQFYAHEDRAGAPSVTWITASRLRARTGSGSVPHGGPRLPRFAGVRLTVSLIDLIPEALTKRMYCTQGFVPDTGTWN